MDSKLCFQVEADVHTKKDEKRNSKLYYRYLLEYVEDVLYIVEDADGPINILDQFFRMR